MMITDSCMIDTSTSPFFLLLLFFFLSFLDDSFYVYGERYVLFITYTHTHTHTHTHTPHTHTHTHTQL
jgi:hypothetical protein